MKRAIAAALCLILCLGLFAQPSARGAARTFFIDDDFDGIYSPGETIYTEDGEIVSAAWESIPAGYGIPANLRDPFGATIVPLRPIADALLPLPAQPIDMRSPQPPPALTALFDTRGNALLSPGGGFEESALRPRSLAEGRARVTFVHGEFKKEFDVPCTFEYMDSLQKANYSYRRGWINAATYEMLVRLIFYAPERVPAAYRSSIKVDPHTKPLPTTAQQPVAAEVDFTGIPYVQTADGRIRIYQYDVAAAQTIGPEAALTVKKLFDEQDVRKRALALMGAPDIPQEAEGQTAVVFNGNLNGEGGQVVERNGAFCIELGLHPTLYTVAHEYTHIVQSAGYGVVSKRGSHLWWMEGTADWVGRVISGDDHYVQRLEPLQNSCWASYDSSESSRSYGTAAFAFYLEQLQSGAVGRTFARAAKYSSGRAAVDAAYPLSRYYATYACRMYRPSVQMPKGLTERSLWPDANAITAGPLPDAQALSISRSNLASMGIDYIVITVQSTGARKVRIDVPQLPEGVQLYLLKRGKKADAWSYQRITAETTLLKGLNTSAKELVLCAVNTGSAPQSMAYSITALP